MRRFFLQPEDSAIIDSRMTITGDLFRHMVKVLRLKNGTRVILADGKGQEHVGSISEIGRGELAVTIESTVRISSVSQGPAITLYQGLPKGDKMELILQKTTELGVAGIIPFPAERSIVQLAQEDVAGKIIRWQRIVREAARQSGRGDMPEISVARGLPEILASAGQTVKLLLWEGEKANTLKGTLGRFAKPESVALIVGPEGGISSAEAAAATAAGFLPVSLGERILRTETAGMAMIAILQFYWGDLG